MTNLLFKKIFTYFQFFFQSLNFTSKLYEKKGIELSSNFRVIYDYIYVVVHLILLLQLTCYKVK